MKYVFSLAAGMVIGAAGTYAVMSASPDADTATAAAQKPERRGDTFSGTFESAYDGDTFRLRSGETLHRVRVWGIDAPERKQTCEQDSRIVACGKMAHAALETLLKQGAAIDCEYKATHQGRIVARCTVDGQDISASLIRQGLAFEDKNNTKGRYSDDEQHARNNKLGLWGMTHDTPAHWRACNLPIAKNLRRPADCKPQ